MNDLLAIVIFLACLGLTLGLIRLCDALMPASVAGREGTSPPSTPARTGDRS